MTAPILVFDFDGTVCLGEAPVDEYCRQVCLRLPEPAAAEVRAAYAAYQAGHSEAPDGYFAIAAALGDRLAPQAASEAYLASRAWLAEHPQAVSLPGGLVDFLHDARDRGACRILLTNSPRHGAEQVLQAHGIADLFDEIRGDARKPARWAEHLADFLSGAAPETLLSIGDVWRNDIAPVTALGSATAFIDERGLASGPATFMAAALPDLYGSLLTWIDDPSRFA